ncbi:hypothetical protein OH76DRAFT_902249 [Lentinus brumalis]|uniref:Uncharacterized protein n=1 Tax=Lentinus brumalis TaxID=2498619 RepID=A0A371D112_9APHY|nr:hypothetical protein OH76DRAFT_902249 [Polyporus brumalis]
MAAPYEASQEDQLRKYKASYCRHPAHVLLSVSDRKRAPLPPQREQWIKSAPKPTAVQQPPPAQHQHQQQSSAQHYLQQSAQHPQQPGQHPQHPAQHLQQPGQHLQQPGQHLQQPGQHLQQPGQHLQQPGQHLQQPGQHLKLPAHHPPYPPRPIRIPSPVTARDGIQQWTKPDGTTVTVNPVNQMPPGYLGHGQIPLYDTPSGRLSRMSGMPNPWDKSIPWPPPRPRGWKPSSSMDIPLSVYYSTPRPDAMDVDDPPPARGPPMSRTESASRNSMGGMYSDRMSASVSAPQEAPRAPRAMVPRDGSSYSTLPSSSSSYPAMSSSSTSYSAMPSSSSSLPNVYSTRPQEPSAYGVAGPSSSHGRQQPPLSPVDRRWGEGSSADRRTSYSGPNPMEPPMAPPKQVVRDLPDRPMGRAPIPEVRNEFGPGSCSVTHEPLQPRGRGRPTGDIGSRPPPRISGTNNVPIGPRTANPFEGGPSSQHPPFHSSDNGYGSRRPFGDERGEVVSDPYGKKVRAPRSRCCYTILIMRPLQPMRYAPANEPVPDHSRAERGNDRGGEQRGGRRPSVSDPMVRSLIAS